MKNDFTAALLKEISLRPDYLQGEPVETIYFGGGTPSLLSDGEMASIMEAVHRHFNVVAAAEITLEANPDDVDPDALVRWKMAGINRLSLGVQSFFGEDLLWMNRAHDEIQAERAVLDAQSAGLDNISIDLIYGLPGLTVYRCKMNISRAAFLQVPHLSCYALTVEPKTPLDKKIRLGAMPNVVQEDQARQFLDGIQWLEESGYEQYEISNFARPGMRSRHNSAYWQSGKYLGLGPSAHSFNGSTRQWNIANNAKYIQSLGRGELNSESETLSAADRLNEYIMTSLRTIEGLDLQQVATCYGSGKRDLLEKKAARYMLADQMILADEKLILTRKGKLFADGIAAGMFLEQPLKGMRVDG